MRIFTKCLTVTLLLAISNVSSAIPIKLDSTNFAEVRFEVPGDPYDFPVTPHLMWFKLGGSSSLRTQTIEFFDGDTMLTSDTGRFSGGLLQFWSSLELPSLHTRTRSAPLIDFEPLRNKSIDGIFRVYIEDSEHSFDTTETVVQFFDCLNFGANTCSITGFTPQPIVKSVQVFSRVTSVPEPSSVILLIACLIGFLISRGKQNTNIPNAQSYFRGLINKVTH